MSAECCEVIIYIPGPPGPPGDGNLPPTIVSSDYSVLSSDRFLVITENCTITMPDAVANVGMYLPIKLFGATLVVFQAEVGGQTFDYQSTLTVNQNITEFNLYAAEGVWLIC